MHIGQGLLSWTTLSVHSPQKAFSHSLHYFGSFKIGNTPKEDKIDTLKTKTKINVKKTGPILNKSQM